MDIVKQAVLSLPKMEHLRDELDETVTLYILVGYERVRIQAVESRHTVNLRLPIGARIRLSVGAASKVLMAFSDETFQRTVLADPTWPSNLNNIEYQSQLVHIRKSGFAISTEEHEARRVAVSVPIFNREGDIVAALAVSGSVSRMDMNKMLQFVPRMISTAEHMSRLVK